MGADHLVLECWRQLASLLAGIPSLGQPWARGDRASFEMVLIQSQPAISLIVV